MSSVGIITAGDETLGLSDKLCLPEPTRRKGRVLGKWYGVFQQKQDTAASQVRNGVDAAREHDGARWRIIEWDSLEERAKESHACKNGNGLHEERWLSLSDSVFLRRSISAV